MQVGWPGLSRAIAVSVVVTSVFWILLGVWLFRAHVAADRPKTGVHAQPLGSLTAPDAAALIRPARTSGDEDAPRVDSPSANKDVYPGSNGLMVPVSGVAPGDLTDTFAQARAQGARRHDALDIPSSDGTAVLAAAPGLVERLFWSHDGGHTIYVRSADRRTIYYYAHLSAYARDLREGMMVKGGQFIGTVGHTGNADASAPHLHFAVWVADPARGWSQQGQAVDPYALLTGRSAPALPNATPVKSP